MSVEPAQPGGVSPAASGGGAPVEEATASAARANPAPDGGGDKNPTPAPNGDDARRAGILGADALVTEAPGAGAGEGGAGADGGSAPAADVPTEVARLAAAVADLDDLGGRPVPEHVGRYDAVHGQLSEALASIDEV